MKFAGYRHRGRATVLTLLLTWTVGQASAQFLEEFNSTTFDEWTLLTGDGMAEMDFRLHDGFASIHVDATRDLYNIWWALIKREVSYALDLERVGEPGIELRVEARIRLSHAPKRVNLHLNTQRTVDFHTHLMEFDIPDTTGWHVISMTTIGFDAEPDDIVNAQLALMDWGKDRYRVDIDYVRVDVVDVDSVGPDLGEPLSYHPPVPPLESFSESVEVLHSATVDFQYPDLNFAGWQLTDASGSTGALAVGGSQLVVLRWDLQTFRGSEIVGPGVLELTARAVQRAETDILEFGQVRVVEILGGDPEWDQNSVTWSSLTRGKPADEVFNTQMIIDIAVSEEPDGKSLAVVSRPVLQRMIDGTTLGLALRPLGPVNAAFFGGDDPASAVRPRLYFTSKERSTN